MNSISQRLEWTLAQVEVTGLSRTKARQEILPLLAARNVPVTLEQIRSQLVCVCDFATVYRTILTFEQTRIVRRVGLQERVAFYALAAPGEHFNYLVCSSCGEVSDLPDASLLAELEQSIARRSGFRMFITN